MATVLLLTPSYSLGRELNYSVNVNPLLKTRTQVHYQLIIKNKSFLIKQRPDQKNNNFRVQCFMKSNKVGFEEEKERREGKSLDEIIQEILKTLNLFIQKSAIAGVILELLMIYNPHLAALAASGGRMGGSSFSSSSSESSSSSDSSPSYSSWGSSSSSSSPSYCSSSVDSSTPKTYYSSQTSSLNEPKTATRKTTALEVLISLGIIVIIAGVIVWCTDEQRQSEESFHEKRQSRQSSLDTKKAATVIMLQVALLGATRSLQKDLDKIAEVADTSTRSGLSYILKESTVALLRHLAYCYSSYSSVDVKADKVDGEKLFKKLTIEERAKFDEETLVNVDNVKKQSTQKKIANGLSSDYIVMTILVAAMGEHKLSIVNNNDKLKEALQKLGSIPTSKILGVEVMWTPQEENDTLTEHEMLEDYPRLRPL